MLIQTHPYIWLSGDGAQGTDRCLKCSRYFWCASAGRTPLVCWENERWTCIRAHWLSFRWFRVLSSDPGPGSYLEDVHAFTLKHFRSSTGSQREIFASESRSGEASRVSLSWKHNPLTGKRGEERTRWNWEWGGLNAWSNFRGLSPFWCFTSEHFFPFHFETLFISQSIKTMCFWFVNTQLIIKMFLDVEICVDSWTLFSSVAPGEKVDGKLCFQKST